MQKLQAELKNVPRDISLVPCSTTLPLNRVQRLSVVEKLLTCNNPEENHQKHRSGSNLRVLNIVYVLNMRKLPLMPTTQSKAKHLLKQCKAKVVKRFPFTIQLTQATGETKQAITLGVDPGYKNIGLSAITDKQELFSAEVILRTNISKLLSEKSMYRRGRRNKLWYREPRFNNRVSSKKEGWLPPSVLQKLNSHIRIIDKICSFLPITKVIVESANFDIQKINNPEIEGKDYQNGVQKDFWNVREYVLYRDNHTCQSCKKKDLILQVHHIETRQTGGDRPDNLVTLCKDCHTNFHKGKIKLFIEKKIGFKAETFMSIVRWKLVNLLTQKYNTEITFGYLTKSKRIKLELEKFHSNDAFCIADGASQERSCSFEINQKRKNNRCLQLNRNGFKPSTKRQRYKIQVGDLFWVENKQYISRGIFSTGSYVLYGNVKKKEYFKTKSIEKFYNINQWQFIPQLKQGVFLP